MKLLILNGPNLNFLGIREKEIYGSETYLDLEEYLLGIANQLNVKAEIYQSNHEGDLIDKIQAAYLKNIDGIILNPGALTHYSYALHDAVKSVDIPCVEVHLSDIKNREDFRKISVIEAVCVKTFIGKGRESYREAMEFLVGEYHGISEIIQ